MKKTVSILLASLMLIVGAAPLYAASAAAQPSGFSDVSPEDWYAPYVLSLSRSGVVRGYGDGTFRPSGSVTWGEALKLVLLSAGFSEQSAAPGEHWAEGYLDFARRSSYLAEDAAPVLGEPLTRSELAKLCAAALELEPAGAGGAPGKAVVQSPFADTSEPEALALMEAGIMQGSARDGLRLFSGGSILSRAEICAVLTRMLEYVDGHFVFVSGYRVPIDFGLRFHSFDPDAFTEERGRMGYTGPGGTARLGVDVSYYQGEINWNAVAADGVGFAIIRCGYRGYGSAGTLNEDTMFRRNIEGALAAGLDVGVYFFSQALSVEEALEEAAFTLGLIEGYDLRFPVVFDWERITGSGSRTRDPDWDTVSDCALAFCGAVAAEGYTPMTYFNKHMSYLQLDMHKMQQYDCWLAMYQKHMDYIYDFQMWQYSSGGSVAGIPGRVDMDICFVDYA